MHHNVDKVYKVYTVPKNVPTLTSSSFDKHELILTIFDKQDQYTFKNDMQIQLSLYLHFYLLHFRKRPMCISDIGNIDTH